jgi:hypothetical protein
VAERAIGAKTLDELIEFLEDIRDEYPEFADQVVLVTNEEGTVDGFVTSVDLSDGVWVLYEEVEG